MPFCSSDQAPSPLTQFLAPWLTTRSAPGTGSFFAVSQQGLQQLALKQGATLRQAMCNCLDAGIWPLRFAANRGVFSPEDQKQLLTSHVAIIGCGGLGGTLSLLLARVGIGTLSVCDHDAFDESNLNRQVLCREDRIGMNKAVAASQELALLASHVTVHVHATSVTKSNLADIIHGADLIADCLDSIPTRLLVERVALAHNLPFVHGALAGFEGFATISRPEIHSPAERATHHPLVQGCIAALYGEASASATAEKKSGTPSPTPLVVAALQSMLIITELLPGTKAPSALWHLDLTEPSITTLQL